MIKNLKEMLPYLLIIMVSYYLLPYLLIKDTGSGMSTLLFLLPMIISITSHIYGYKSKKFNFIFNILVGLLFLPVVFIYMNTSALIYVIIYSIISLILNYLGKTL
ncbi:MAG: DUF2651 family protein [Bacilli bacterium]|nr:DUF2651 family protein [Bacilli bacterium]MDD4795846.1 DUF2651 family protein [Bacilli bacterium]